MKRMWMLVLGGVGCVDLPEQKRTVQMVESGVLAVEDTGPVEADADDEESAVEEDDTGVEDMGRAGPEEVHSLEPCDGVDNDGDGMIDESGGGGGGYLDLDGDGFGDIDGWRDWLCLGPNVSALGNDCDDTDATVYPDAPEICEDGVANDCSANPVDATCLVAAACPDFWPLGLVEGQSIPFRDGEDRMLWTSGYSAGTVWSADAWEWDSRASYSTTTEIGACDITEESEHWVLACTAEGVVRTALEAEEYWNYEGWESSNTVTERFSSPPLALPFVVEEGVTWDEVGVRHGRTGDGVWGLATADPAFTTVHTVTECGVEAVEPTGNRTVCTISSLDDDGRSWTWKVAEGLGPIDIDGANRLWVN